MYKWSFNSWIKKRNPHEVCVSFFFNLQGEKFNSSFLPAFAACFSSALFMDLCSCKSVLTQGQKLFNDTSRGDRPNISGALSKNGQLKEKMAEVFLFATASGPSLDPTSLLSNIFPGFFPQG
jgi:hypothetical protein